MLAPLPARAAQILAVRVWPADDYTRVTLENDSNLKTSHFIVKNPERLVVDIEGIDLNPTLKRLVAKIQSNDPYIKQVRVGQNRPERGAAGVRPEGRSQAAGVHAGAGRRVQAPADVRPVSGQPARPDRRADRRKATGAATQPPVPAARRPAGEPIAQPKPRRRDAGQAAQARSRGRRRRRNVTRMITIALDPGHGGEDPGAIGRRGSREKDVVLAIAKRLKAQDRSSSRTCA